MNGIFEVITIVKIKEGFFIGDLSAGTNEEIIKEYKISHIINTTNNKLLNHFEKLGIKYLTLNWIEYPDQQLFELNDENIIKLMKFIENNDKKGEGILVFSIKCQNRACIVAIIYLIKKYNWSLKKCIEYIKSKKIKVSIPSYFMKQLNDFEIRINFQTKIKKSKDWDLENNNLDKEEFIMRNTYMNSVFAKNVKMNKKYFNNNNYIINKVIRKKVRFKDEIFGNDLITINKEKDLFLKKTINDIKNHILMKPNKNCLKVEKVKKTKKINNTVFNNTISLLNKNKENQIQNIMNSSYQQESKHKIIKNNCFLKISQGKVNQSLNNISQKTISILNIPLKVDSLLEKNKNNKSNSSFSFDKNLKEKKISNSCINIFNNNNKKSIKLPFFSPSKNNKFNVSQEKFYNRNKNHNNQPIKINNQNLLFISPQKEAKKEIFKRKKNELTKRPLSSIDKAFQFQKMKKLKRAPSPMLKTYNLRYYFNDIQNNNSLPESFSNSTIGKFIKMNL